MDNRDFMRCAQSVKQFSIENSMQKILGWQQSKSNPKIALIKTEQGIVPVKSFGGGFITIIQPWAKDYNQLCSEYDPNAIEWQLDTCSPYEQTPVATEKAPQVAPETAPQVIPGRQPQATPEPISQTPVVEHPVQPQMIAPPESLPPAFVNWADINRKRKGILPSFLNLSGIFFFYIALRLFFNNETTVVGIFAIPLAIFLWLVLGGIASLIRSLRTIETYTANIYEQAKYQNKQM